jgi:hypothetical protein
MTFNANEVNGSTVLALSNGGFVELTGISLANWSLHGVDNVLYAP